MTRWDGPPPQVVRFDLQTVELKGQLDDKITYDFWTFKGKVPGPFVRVRVGDTVEVHLTNAENSLMSHSVDFHAATGPVGARSLHRPGRARRRSSPSRPSSSACSSITARRPACRITSPAGCTG